MKIPKHRRGFNRPPDPPPALLSGHVFNGYRPGLDGLRCVAILLVLVQHFGPLPGIVSPGYYGVDLFFVISGFLITGILIRDSRVSFAANYRIFVGRRALRIFPPYYLLLAVLLLIDYHPVRELFPSLVTYTFNYVAALYPWGRNDNPAYYLWSLSVEEQFYLVWPLIAIGLRKRKLILLAVTVAIVLIGYSQLIFGIVPSMSKFNYVGLFNRMGSLGLGAFGAAYVAWRPLPAALFNSRILEGMATCSVGLALAFFGRTSLPVLGLCSLFFVLKASHFNFRIGFLDAVLRNDWVAYIGSISYGIYLFHVPIAAIFNQRVFDPLWVRVPFSSFGAFEKLQWHPWILRFPLLSGLGIGVAAVSYHWFEKPILTRKNKWFRYR